jgi:hypothetical protein
MYFIQTDQVAPTMLFIKIYKDIIMATIDRFQSPTVAAPLSAEEPARTQENAMSTSESNQPFYTNEELKRLHEDRVMEMLFEGDENRDIHKRQATYELSRRQEEERNQLQNKFMTLSALSAFASAVAAIGAFFW